jgi:Ni/Co efflux regulator RcnB
MKKALATLAAISMIATPVFAASAQATNNTMSTKTTKSTKASKSVAKQAKAEGESTKTEAKEVRHHAMAKHHAYGKYSRCKPSHMAKAHHKTMHKAAAKTTKTAAKKG